MQQVNAPIDSLAAWPRIAVTLIAWLTPVLDAATTQIPTAMLDVHQRNWFYAWLWSYRRLLEQESGLGTSLADVNGGDRSGGGVLTDLFGRVGSFIQAQDGLVGQQLGQTFAAASLNSFLQSGLDKFSLEERTQLLTGVTSGVKSLSNKQPFSTFEGSRTNLNLQIDSRVSTLDPGTRLSEFDSRLSQIENDSLTQLDIANIQANILAEANRTNTAQIDQLRSEFNGVLGGKADTTSLEQLRTEVDSALNQKADASNIDVLRAELNDTLGTKADNSRIDQIDSQVVKLGDQTRSFNTSLERFDTRLKNVDQRIGRLDTRTPRRP